MEIKDFFERYKTSAWDKDQAAMSNLYKKNALIFDMWDKGFTSTSAEWHAIIEEWFNSLGEEKVNVEFDMIHVHQSDTIGFDSALIKYEAISSEGAVLRSMTNRITLGFSKGEEGWKVTHQHQSAPVSSEGMTAILSI